MSKTHKIIYSTDPDQDVLRSQYDKQQTRYYKEAEEHNERIDKQVHLQYKKSLRIIKTIRDIEETDYRIKGDYTSLIKEIVQSNKLKILHTVTRNVKSGKISYASELGYGSEITYGEEIIGEAYIYPYESETSFAMYLVPVDIKVGERIVLEDLIEDYIGSYINNIPYRLKQCEAVWNGKDFDIDYDSVIIEMDWAIG